MLKTTKTLQAPGVTWLAYHDGLRIVRVAFVYTDLTLYTVTMYEVKL